MLPQFTGEYRLAQFTYVAIYFIAILGLNILTGYNGQISLGHGAFMAIGAYTTAMLILGRPGLEDLNIHPPAGFRSATGCSRVHDPDRGARHRDRRLRLRVPGLAASGRLARARDVRDRGRAPLDREALRHLTGGGGGLNLPLPTTPFGLRRLGHRLALLPGLGDGRRGVRPRLAARARPRRSGWRAIRDGEIAAVSSGVSPACYKTLAFGISSAYAGVAGALFAIQVSYVNPDTFPVRLSILLLASVVVGGLSSLTGVIFGAILMEFLPIYAQQISKQAPAVAFGATLIICMLVLPAGAAGLLHRVTADTPTRLSEGVSRRPRTAR